MREERERDEGGDGERRGRRGREMREERERDEGGDGER